MNFAYLNLPSIPPEFESLVYDNLKLIGVDPLLNHLNTKEAPNHNITYVPAELTAWILKNIMEPINSPFYPGSMMIHAVQYMKHKEGNGVLPIHYDYGRNFTLNYLFETGGDNVVTSWYLDDKKTITDQVVVEPRRWCIMRVKPTYHGVHGIEWGKHRIMVGVNYSPKDYDSFDAQEYFKDLIVND